MSADVLSYSSMESPTHVGNVYWRRTAEASSHASPTRMSVASPASRATQEPLPPISSFWAPGLSVTAGMPRTHHTPQVTDQSPVILRGHEVNTNGHGDFSRHQLGPLLSNLSLLPPPLRAPTYIFHGGNDSVGYERWPEGLTVHDQPPNSANRSTGENAITHPMLNRPLTEISAFHLVNGDFQERSSEPNSNEESIETNTRDRRHTLSLGMQSVAQGDLDARWHGESTSNLHSPLTATLLDPISHQLEEPIEQELHYALMLREQPKHARVMGFSGDGRPFDPIPVVQLLILDSYQRDITSEVWQNSDYFVRIELYDAQGTRSMMKIKDARGNIFWNLAPRTRDSSLMKSGEMLKDDRDRECCLFCFTNLCCRLPGTYRLKFTLFRLDVARMPLGQHFPSLVTIFGDAFKAVLPREYLGNVQSSNFAVHLGIGRRSRPGGSGPLALESEAGPRRGRER